MPQLQVEHHRSIRKIRRLNEGDLTLQMRDKSRCHGLNEYVAPNQHSRESLSFDRQLKD